MDEVRGAGGGDAFDDELLAGDVAGGIGGGVQESTHQEELVVVTEVLRLLKVLQQCAGESDLDVELRVRESVDLPISCYGAQKRVEVSSKELTGTTLSGVGLCAAAAG